MNLQQLMEHMFKLYGRRNAVYLSGIADRLAFLALGIRNLEDAIEDGRKDEYRYFLASVFARICAVAENFHGLSVVASLCMKYPPAGCSYCGQSPCVGEICKGGSQAHLQTPTSAQLEWTLAQFQQHAKNLYGENNKKKGISHAISRLFSELTEMISLNLIITHSPRSLAEMYHEYGLELADTLAWTIAIANLLDIDLEEAVLELYGDGCKTCKQASCRCGAFNMAMRRMSDLIGTHSVATK